MVHTAASISNAPPIHSWPADVKKFTAKLESHAKKVRSALDFSDARFLGATEKVYNYSSASTLSSSLCSAAFRVISAAFRREG
jgi:hypothetical protein